MSRRISGDRQAAERLQQQLLSEQARCADLEAALAAERQQRADAEASTQPLAASGQHGVGSGDEGELARVKQLLEGVCAILKLLFVADVLVLEAFTPVDCECWRGIWGISCGVKSACQTWDWFWRLCRCYCTVIL